MIVPLRLRRGRAAFLACLLSALVIPACDTPTSANEGLDLSDTVPLAGGGALVFSNAGAIAPYRPRIEQIVRDTVAGARGLIPLDGITVIIGAGLANVIPEIGFGGRADGGTVHLTFDPESSVVAANLDTELFPLLAHELHHVARIRAVGYGDNLLGAMVSEGLADQFAVELASVDPPIWSTALTPQQVATWSGIAQQQWLDANYDHASWFFGNGSIPRWTGYTLGFELTSAYLARNPETRASDLIGEPATSFIAAGAGR